MMLKSVKGNTEGIKETVLNQIAGIYDIPVTQDEFVSYDLLCAMAAFSCALNRELSVYLSRDGRILDVSVGDSHKVSMPDMRVVRNQDRLSGVRCIHTHPGGDARLSEVDIGTLRASRLDAMAAVGVIDGKPVSMYAAFLGELIQNQRQTIIHGPIRPYKINHKELLNEIAEADNRLKSSTKDVAEVQAERAILVGLENGDGYDSLSELAELAATAGAIVVGRETQKRKQVDNATYIGSGKAEELSLTASELEADIVIFDDELSAIQQRNLENAIGIPVIDRTTLILDIFAARATSREGKLQVELAQLKYRLPRLLGKGLVLSRLGGGIGTKGPGEKKLEIDRRRIRRRIFELEQELSEIEKQRSLRRENREAGTTPAIALVGYTNAGKSTLLNRISEADVLAEDKLFATLDPVVRQITLPGGTNAVVSDTVGFINKLPHDLIKAFHSTLEEVSNADLLLHIIDCSSDYYDVQMRVVEDVLVELNAGEIPRINVYNKVDKLSVLPGGRGEFSLISAKEGSNINELLELAEKKLMGGRICADILIPYEKYSLIAVIRKKGSILSEEHKEDGVKLSVNISEPSYMQIIKALES